MLSVSALVGPAIGAALFALAAGGGHRYPLRSLIGPPTVWTALATQALLLIIGPLVASLLSRTAKLPLALATLAGASVPLAFAASERAWFGEVPDSVVGGPLEIVIAVVVTVLGYRAFGSHR